MFIMITFCQMCILTLYYMSFYTNYFTYSLPNPTSVILTFIFWNLIQIIPNKRTFKKVWWHYHLNHTLCWHQQKCCLPLLFYIFSQFQVKIMIVFLLSNNTWFLLFFKINYAIRVTIKKTEKSRQTGNLTWCKVVKYFLNQQKINCWKITMTYTQEGIFSLILFCFSFIFLTAREIMMFPNLL